MKARECGRSGGGCEEDSDYPGCHVGHLHLIGNGECNNQHDMYNNEECGWDGGDCIPFNKKFPNCLIEDAFKIGDGECDKEYSNGGLYDTLECGWDGGDCF